MGFGCYLIRHGEVEANVRRIYAGRADVPLTERGLAQAEHTAAALLTSGIVHVYAGFTELSMGRYPDDWRAKALDEIAG